MSQEITAVLSAIPDEALNCLAFQDSLSGIWRYEFGNASRESPAIGDHTFPKLQRLLRAITTAQSRMFAEDYKRWSSRLWNETQHQSVLEELAPIFHLQGDIGVFPEVPSGRGNVDWELLIPNFPSNRFLLEVKLRHGDLDTHIKEIAANPHSFLNAPQTDADDLFKNLEHKFDDNKPSDILQGAWIATWVKPEVSAVTASFRKLPDRVHFALIVPPGADHGATFLLTREYQAIPRTHILNVFGLRHDPSLVYGR